MSKLENKTIILVPICFLNPNERNSTYRINLRGYGKIAIINLNLYRKSMKNSILKIMKEGILELELRSTL